ncbi:MAG: hypothetical protein LBF80_03435 [Spirochaetaceae bacterium]|jgi:hypothetical protein|nr:hypothetical protein [Spirochaetaceae bacterium]
MGTDNVFLSLETLGFLRLYLFSPLEMDTPKGIEAFIGVGVGIMATVNTTEAYNSRGSLELAGKIGVRFRFGKHFYIEPYMRGGYPFLAGGGLVAGFRFPADSVVPTTRGETEITPADNTVQTVYTETEKTVPVTTLVYRVPEYAEYFYIVFQSD